MTPTIPPIRRIPVGVLGATGAVGQTFIRLVANHPWFDVTAVAASERSAGKSYREATHWLGGELPERVANLTVTCCDPAAVHAPVVFSALVQERVRGGIDRAAYAVVAGRHQTLMSRTALVHCDPGRRIAAP